MKARKTHGTGRFKRSQFAKLGQGVVLEPGILVFHPENIELGDAVYVGHHAVLKGYHKNNMRIGDGTWIGQRAFLHAAGGLTIGREVGIGPGVTILTSAHDLKGRGPILRGKLVFSPVTLEDGCDIGANTVILPGVTVGRGAQVGAGAVVSKNIPAYAVAAGNPARVLRQRK